MRTQPTYSILMNVKSLLLLTLLIFVLLPLSAQTPQPIDIGGNVYGGGNMGVVNGNTTVTVCAGDLHQVFGGARMADVGGRTFVHVDGEHASGFIVIDKAFGGNDLAGVIGSNSTVKEVPADILHHEEENGIDDRWDAYVHLSTKMTGTGDEATEDAAAKKVYIGQLYAGGNGDYNYEEEVVDGVTTHILKDIKTNAIVATTQRDFVLPELNRTYMEVCGGSIVYAYGGGNNATVKLQSIICVDNPSKVVNEIKVKDGVEDDEEGTNILDDARFHDRMEINTGFSYPSSDKFQIGSFFGGNNKADMAIRPTWNLMSGKIRNIYSGGNRGRMTSPEGILLEIRADSKIIADNVFGGCRMADVRPLDADGKDVTVKNLPGYGFPDDLSARLLVRGGDINNVYGGNDITGKVWGGTAVGIYTSVRGDVYGAGNGAYPYTDNDALKDDDIFGDLYYDPGSSSVDSLNAFRPNVEQVSLRLDGISETKKTILNGSVYVGGNCATIVESSRPNPMVELKVGSYVIADTLFLGNNGAGMVEYQDAGRYAEMGVLRTMQRTDIASDGTKYNSLNLTDDDTFSKYMDGCAMTKHPNVVFDNTAFGDPENYIEYSSFFGSFYCGGNVGSMIESDLSTIDFTHKIIIFNKLVGGSNNANVAATSFNAAYKGGVIGAEEERVDGGYTEDGTVTGPIKDRLVINLDGLRIRPMRWKMTTVTDPEDDSKTIQVKYINPTTLQPELEWNTFDVISGLDVTATDYTGTSTENDLNRRLRGGNIYGGCYNSGHVNGNVIINIKSDVMDPSIIFDEVAETGKLYDYETFTITKRNSGVILAQQGMDVLGSALNLFGGGYGADSEIWGSATVNFLDGYIFQIYGGGENGPIGKRKADGSFDYDSRYSTYVNLSGRTAASATNDVAETEFLYGGGFQGTIAGNTHVYLGNGRFFNSFAGSCNADILGHTETYVGRNMAGDLGFPYALDHIYGANDLGGRILSLGGEDINFASRVKEGSLSKLYSYNASTNPSPDILKAGAYTEYLQGHADYIFGGCYGDYDYTDPHYADYTYTRGGDGTTAYNLGLPREGFTKPRLDNAFVNLRPVSSNNPDNGVLWVFGAGQGYQTPAPVDLGHYPDPEQTGQYPEIGKDSMQMRSYVLIDIPQEYTAFRHLSVFGSGANCGLGMGKSPVLAAANPDAVSAIVDLLSGQIGDVYGGGYHEGVTRRTVVNVPEGSTISLGSIFGGSLGDQTNYPCDVYESNVNWSSSLARVSSNIYGGNNNERRTLYAHVNINDTVWSNKESGYLGRVFGAGKGANTWAEYTEVNLNSGAYLYEVYGGGDAGSVQNAEILEKGFMRQFNKLPMAWKLGAGYDGVDFQVLKAEQKLLDDASVPLGFYYDNPLTNLDNTGNDDGRSDQVNPAEMDDRDYTGYSPEARAHIDHRYNTNVLIHEGATVTNYAYGGGYGASAFVGGTTYIALLGGKVVKDIYAAGTSGAVEARYGPLSARQSITDFIASANAYIKGGTCRNVYGGGWEGAVGFHDGALSASYTTDVAGETHVVIGDLDGTTFLSGIPAVERNAYGGGEGGAVWGTTNITLNKGYIGYRYFPDQTTADADYADFASLSKNSTAVATDVPIGIADGGGYYQEKLHDETWKGDGTHRLYDSGNIFGGGYIDNSSVDVSHVKMLGGHVRNALFGGGEIAAVGRGVINASGEHNSVRTLEGIYKAGKTNVQLYDGHVHRNVFGGGRGYNNLGEGGTLYSDGYVFGQTEVNIFGGEIGTDAELSKGNGNVFGGGDIGYVYSAYDDEHGHVAWGKKDDAHEGYYFEYEDGAYVVDPGTGENILTEDCKVLVEPHCQVTDNDGITINGVDYAKGQYVPTDALNYLGNKNTDAAQWGKLDTKGIIIHNAVFAGGNTSSGSDKVYANATSIFGNATASIHDVYHRDLITVGTGHTGGLYGDGNLTFVDGYRELNITNYGTDYYNIQKEITKVEYDALPAREAAYYELRYTCLKSCVDTDGTRYSPKDEEEGIPASTISSDDLITLFKDIWFNTSDYSMKKMGPLDDKTGYAPMLNIDGKTPNPEFWEQSGVVSRYAGRVMNTIQRADFCGVFGSRMVMQGAQDRVPEIVDYTNYTINRVREVSLNKKISVIDVDRLTDRAFHGNYFGIYNIVNFLGALTSDVDFGDDRNGGSSTTEGNGNVDGYYTRTTSNSDKGKYGPNYDYQTFYQWKRDHKGQRWRNNGNSHNQVALASGVYLELTSEESTGDGLYEKDWGTITGVIELDLINVQTGIGGGFVYARNEHGLRNVTGMKHITLTALNADAITEGYFSYDNSDENAKKEWQTSGNFVHSSQIIIDDCYNISGKYKSGYHAPDGVPAHYWYIQGEVYVYDQYISAYTGAADVYTESNLPLTITAAAHSTMKLLNVQPNLYAYYSAENVPLTSENKIIINEKSYYKNDPISYWDWYLLTPSERLLFVPETYVTIAECTIGETTYPEGTVLLPGAVDGSNPGTYYALRKAVTEESVSFVAEGEKDFDFVFRPSNNMSHDTGYILTYRMNNPVDWDQWYTEKIDTAHESLVPREKNQTGGTDYYSGPTYHLTSGTEQVLGQQTYKEGDIISEYVYNAYETDVKGHISEGQATFEPAYIIKENVTVNEGGGESNHKYVGAIVSETYKNSHSELTTDNTSIAYICTSTVQLSNTEYIYLNDKLSDDELTAYINRFRNPTIDGNANPEYNPTLADEIEEKVIPAYYCTGEGLYGGNCYESGKNYRGLEAWSSMSDSERQANYFAFNYDVFDLLIDPDFGGYVGDKWQYDADLSGAADDAAKKALAEANPAGYSLQKPVDYTATYNGDETATYNGVTLSKGTEYTRAQFESLPNEQRNYSSITAAASGVYYVVNTGFQIGNTPYAVGATITPDVYNSLGFSEKENVTQITVPNAGTYYYCRESYKVGHNGNGVSVTNAADVTATNSVGDPITQTGTYTDSSTNPVPAGFVIDAATYALLVANNKQQDFSIHAISPTETSMLFVARNSDIFNLSSERIYTVIYQYDFEESDESGNIVPQTERHIINIHVTFKSGVPIVEDIKTPQLILPGDLVSFREPNVLPGAYEVTGGGWEIYENPEDAEVHTNGIHYSPNFDPLYWYQNGYHVAYYARTYLGKTYSNHVPVSVANYHDLKRVMDDKEHHYYVDNPDVDRKSKIYVNDYGTSDPATSQNGLNLLKDFFDLSLLNRSDPGVTDGVVTAEGPLEGHALLDTHVHAADNLEFFLRTDLSADADPETSSGYATWTSIGTTTCFEGTLHGDGHTISGLDHSLFDRLCGDVYNLGVTGSFTSAGIANQGSGYMENCWTYSTATTSDTSPKPYAVFGNPERGSGTQIVNCYFWEGNNDLYNTSTSNNITTSGGARGTSRAMSSRAFYTGEVAYDLNGFYLNKRYFDNRTKGAATAEAAGSMLGCTATDYSYYDATASMMPLSTSYYPASPDAQYGFINYVEQRFADGDFRYAAGTIPETEDERTHTDPDIEELSFYPIWPDDYIFFGQMLNYGYSPIRAHQDYPSHISKTSTNRLPITADNNRVYRAPAYFSNKNMDVAHFNPAAVFAAKSSDATREAFPRLTAIDFTGYNDNTWAQGRVADGFPIGKPAFYPPLLDDNGLTSFQNVDLTSNLLAYIPTPAAVATAPATMTHNVVSDYLAEPTYAESNATYHTVDLNTTVTLRGHRVVKDTEGAGYTAPVDHYLVDREDFNAPIAYTFAGDKRMWYQRTPDKFVDFNSGWDAVSLPFTAQLVTTQQKGEITHFYTGSTTGHEYWLRRYAEMSEPDDEGTAVANMTYPQLSDGSGTAGTSVAFPADKTDGNTFLWDYYYSKSDRRDAHSDEYQQYYNSPRTYEDYPYSKAGMPYIIGFPGVRYYEFDLSGTFVPEHTYVSIGKLDKQIVTFASPEGTSIGVSDDEIAANSIKHGNYVFTPCYLTTSVEDGSYLLNADGDSYAKVTDETTDADRTVLPFRPYFVYSSSGAKRRVAEVIIFSNEDAAFADSQDEEPEQRPSDEELGNGALRVYAKRGAVVVESTLREPADVRITSVSGVNVAVFRIEPGDIIETPVGAKGVYIVNSSIGRVHSKKLSVN